MNLSKIFMIRFMKVYNAIPTHFKPPLGFSQLQYAEYFDSGFTLWLSERKSTSLADMMNDAIEIEVNLIAAREKGRGEGRGRNKYHTHPSPSNTP